jgi:DNA-binding NtrC family response regulator
MTPVFDHMVGASPLMQDVFARIEKLAPTDLTVLIVGETGTGKELVARSLHARSPCRSGPLVAVNCSALPDSLIESELFGFEPGSFTGAVRAHEGLVERADGGTLFLDEIAEMPIGAQSKLLRVLQDRRVRRIGSTRERSVAVRVLAATHQDLPLLVRCRAFRVDLYHRLNEGQVHLPPLRERREDIEPIAEAVLARVAGELGRTLRFTESARQALRDHAWPGNVRELENCVQRAAACTAGERIDAADLQLAGREQAPRRLAEWIDCATEAAVRDSLRRHAGCAEAAARELDVPVARLRELAARFRIPLA